MYLTLEYFWNISFFTTFYSPCPCTVHKERNTFTQIIIISLLVRFCGWNTENKKRYNRTYCHDCHVMFSTYRYNPSPAHAGKWLAEVKVALADLRNVRTTWPHKITPGTNWTSQFDYISGNVWCDAPAHTKGLTVPDTSSDAQTEWNTLVQALFKNCSTERQ